MHSPLILLSVAQAKQEEEIRRAEQWRLRHSRRPPTTSADDARGTGRRVLDRVVVRLRPQWL